MLYNLPMYIDDTPGLTITQIRSKARRLKQRNPDLGLICVDYIGLMGTNDPKASRERQVALCSMGLKNLAKELNVCVLALSQLNRGVEMRDNKRPRLSDLRESGAIEQDADIVSFIYRPEYYGIEEWDDEEHSSSIGQAELILAKHRNGGLDNIRMKFIGNLGKFEDLQTNDLPYEFQSKMNGNDPSNETKGNLPGPNDAFDLPKNGEDDMPF